MSSFQTIRLIALREIQLRLRSRAFRISTGIIMAGVIVAFAGGQFVGDLLPGVSEEYTVGLVDDDAGVIGAAMDETASRLGMELELTRFETPSEAELALRDGDLDAVLVDREALLFDGGAIDDILVVANEAVRALRLPGQLEALGLSPEDVQPILRPEPLATTVIDEDDDTDLASLAVAGISMIALFVSILSYGQWVVNGVIEEKSNRVVEVLLSTVRPYQLLAGKVAGILSLAMMQLGAIAGLSLVLTLATPGVEIPMPAALGMAAAVTWFVLGLVFYGVAYGVAGALVSRQEEANNVTMPLMVLLGAGYFMANIVVINSPGSMASTIVSIIPFTAPLTMPVRVALGEAAVWEFALAVGLMLVTIAAAIVVGGRIYAGAILSVGPRVALRDAWRVNR